jgi:hypothetical protein
MALAAIGEHDVVGDDHLLEHRANAAELALRTLEQERLPEPADAQIRDDPAAMGQQERRAARPFAALLERLHVGGEHAVEPTDPIRAADLEQPAVVHREEAHALADARRIGFRCDAGRRSRRGSVRSSAIRHESEPSRRAATRSGNAPKRRAERASCWRNQSS